MAKEIKDFLKNNVGLFKEISDHDLEIILERSLIVSYEVHDAILRIGQEASFLGVVLEGELSISVYTEDGVRRELIRFKAGDSFAEMPLMSGEKTTADYIAEKHCQILQIPLALFKSVILTEPNALQYATKTMIDRVRVLSSDPEKIQAAFSKSSVADTLKAQRHETILIEVSAHHIHLSQEHVEALFGTGHQLTHESDLSQPGQFAAREKLTIVGPKGRIEKVRVLGPVRKATQVEISMTEQYKLGIHPPIKESGDLKGTPGCTLEGPAGIVELTEGVICALRHIHMNPEDAQKYGLKDKSTVRVRVAGDRELIFGDVLIRVKPSYNLAMHIDTDEANAANIKTGTQAWIDGIQMLD